MTEAVFDETSLLPRLPFTKKIRSTLEGLSAEHPVGLGAAPRFQEGKEWRTRKPPYFILYPSWAQTSGGGWNSPDADVDWYYQIRCVGETVDQVEWMRDKVMRLILGRRKGGAYMTLLPIPGMTDMSRWLEDDTGIPSDSEGGVWQSDLRFGFRVTPRA